jgi:single-strand DNA-binding protein
MASRGLNKVQVIGNLGADPEERHSEGGSPVSNFRVAVNRRWKDAEGSPQEHTEWIPAVAFGPLAEVCNQYLSKGREVYVEGRMQTRSWDDAQGNRRYRTEVLAQDVIFLGQRSEVPEMEEEEVPF